MTARDVEILPNAADLMQRLREMARYLPVLEDPDFRPGEFSPVQKTESGSTVMPYVIFGDVAEDFIRAAYEHGWVLRGFDWVSWARSDEADALWNDPSALARAAPEQLLYLLTGLIRQDRFSEGTLLGAFDSGLILAIARRAVAILDDEQASVNPTRSSQ